MPDVHVINIKFQLQYQTCVVTSIKQPLAFEGLYYAIPNVPFNSKLTCIKQPPASKGHFTLSHVRLLKASFTAHI